MRNNSSAGLGLGLFAIALIGLGLIIAPFNFPQIAGPARTVLVILGIGALTIGLLGMTITKLYVRSRPDMAFVRSGLGGPRVVVDGGALVLPVFHEVKWIPTNTMRVDVARAGTDALITSDKLRARVKANFFITIPKDEDMIRAAAGSLPDMSAGQRAVEDLISEKLVGALRTVATSQTLNELNSDRQKFQEEVQKTLATDLALNGLKLESVNISELDQEDPASMRPDSNILDAEGMRTITEITTRNRVARTQMEMDAERQVKDQTVETQKYLAEKDREQAEAVAAADASKRQVAAEREREAKESEIAAQTSVAKVQAAKDAEASIMAAQQKKTAESERISTEKAIALADTEKQQLVAVRVQEAKQAEDIARIAAERATQIAQREQEIAIAEAEKMRAIAEAEQLTAQKDQEAASQAVQTTIMVAEADRRRQAAIIAKEAEAQSAKVELQTAADVDAYTAVTKAQAEQDAATKRAEAMLTGARAEQAAKKLAAEGDAALQLVPVQVDAERVAVEGKRVEVLKQELQAKSENAAVSVELEMRLAMIHAMKEAEIAKANAWGEAMAKANITMFGDPEMMAKMNAQYYQGQGLSRMLEGAGETLPEWAKAGLGAMTQIAVEKFTAKEPAPVAPVAPASPVQKAPAPKAPTQDTKD